MAKFIIKKYTMFQSNKAEYKEIKVNNCYWFEANSTDDAVKTLHSLMENTSYILSIETEKGYKPFYKAVKDKNGIRVLNDTRQ